MRLARLAAWLTAAFMFAAPALAGSSGPGMGPGSGAATEAKRLLEGDGGKTFKYSPTCVLVRFNPATPESLRTAIRGKVSGSVARSYTIVPGLELMAVGVRPEAAVPILIKQSPWV